MLVIDSTVWKFLGDFHRWYSFNFELDSLELFVEADGQIVKSSDFWQPQILSNARNVIILNVYFNATWYFNIVLVNADHVELLNLSPEPLPGIVVEDLNNYLSQDQSPVMSELPDSIKYQHVNQEDNLVAKMAYFEF